MDEEVEVARLELVKYVTSDNVVVKLRLSEDMNPA